jgi:predicted AlkP superfamily pyrophosphatase or phosphodiesterase
VGTRELATGVHGQQPTGVGRCSLERKRSFPGHLLVFVLIDALGWQFLEGREFLSDLLSYRKPVRTVLGFSSGAIPTILTGVPPAQTGHWNLFYYDPEGSPFRWLRPFASLPDRLLNNRVVRKLIKEVGRSLLGLGSNFECCVSPRLLPWFNFVEKRNIYERGGITGAPSIFDQLAGSRIPYRVYTYHQALDKEILRLARQDIERGEAAVYFVYLSEMDRLLHDQLKQSNRLEEALEWYAAELRELFTRAQEIDPEVSVAVFSDHGMTPVEHSYDLVSEIEGLGFLMPEDYLAVYDSTMARYWFFKDRARSKIVEHLKTMCCGRIVPDDELRNLGIFFPDRRYGQLIFLLHPGWLLSRSDFNGPRWMPAGMHGYHPDDPYSDAIFLSNHEPPCAVRTIADVHEYMQVLLKNSHLHSRDAMN